MTTYASFDEWMNEMEGFGVRAERAAEDLGPNWKLWLETAWRLGAESEREACARVTENIFEGFPSIASAIRARSGET